MIDNAAKFPFTPMQTATLCALALHVIILYSLPSIDSWQLPFSDQGLRLNVALQLDDEELDQRLNSQDGTEAIQTNPALSVSPQSWGEQDIDQSPSVDDPSNRSDSERSQAIGLSTNNAINLSSVLSHQALLKFARQDAARHADANPEEVRRFNRSFNSRRRVQQRKRNSYRNQYGDTYINNKGSPGEICFVKTNEPSFGPDGTQDAPTYTVHFFRCGRSPSRK